MLWPSGTYPHPQRIQIGSKDGEWLWVIKEEMECASTPGMISCSDNCPFKSCSKAEFEM